MIAPFSIKTPHNFYNINFVTLKKVFLKIFIIRITFNNTGVLLNVIFISIYISFHYDTIRLFILYTTFSRVNLLINLLINFNTF